MSMLTLQVLALLLLFGLIGAFLGWLIRPFFCKPGAMGGRGNLSGSANANAKMGNTGAALKGSAAKGQASGKTVSGKAKANQGSNGGKAAAAGVAAAAAATAAAVAASKKKDDAAARARADAEKAAQKAAQKAKADQAAKQAAIEADKKKLAAEAEAKRMAEKAKADQEAAEKAKAAKLAEEKRLAEEKAKAAKLAEEQRIAEAKAQAAQAAKQAAIEADKKKLAAEAEAARKAEADRIAAEKARAEHAAKLEADRVAAEKAKAEQAAKDAAAKAEADRIAAEKVAAEKAAADAATKAEADRVAAEKAKAEQAAKDAAAKAEADRIAAEKAKAEQAAKDAAAKAEADRIAAERAKAEQAAKDAAAKAEADRIAAEQKAKADQAAKDAADRASKIAADRAAADKAAAERAAAAKLAAAAAATAAAASIAAKSAGADDEDVSVTEDMRPQRLTAPRDGNPDDLKRIKGIGPVIEGTLNEEGVYHFQQIADFTPDNIKWVDKNVSIPGRVERDDWMGQAQALIDGRDYDGYAKDIAGTDDPSLPPVTEDMRPAKLAGPTGGKADDLKRINGIGPVIEKTLNQEGIYHFHQIADFTPDNVNWVDRHISFPGRITREEWIRQAKGLAAEDGSDSGKSGSDDAAEDIVITEDMRPARRSLDAGQKADDLKVINGIGPVIEKSLNAEGVYFYQQIADFDDDNTKWVDNHMAFPGRIHREDWIAQAKVLVGQKGAGGSGSANADGSASGASAQAEAVTEEMRPTRRTLSAGDKADDLKVINGIGPVIEEGLNKEGIYFYQQIADFDEDNTKWVDNHMAFPGRIHREDWIAQAKVLVDQKGAGGSGSGNTGGSTAGASGQAEVVITEEMRPTRRTLSSGEKADDLKVINGIGPVIEEGLNKEGIYFYQQIADFNEDNTNWVDNHMAFPGRIHREDWIGQAKVLLGQQGAGGRGSAGSSESSASKPVTSAVGSGLGSSGAVPDSMKPTLLTAPEGGKADDLKRIKGIGKVLERNLHEMGIYHYEQLADLTRDNIAWLTDYVSFPEGRIDDEKWTSQAKALADGKQTEYSQRFDKGDTPYK